MKKVVNVNPKSIENLALGRKGKGKIYKSFSLLPSTIATLDKFKNKSDAIDKAFALLSDLGLLDRLK